MNRPEFPDLERHSENDLLPDAAQCVCDRCPEAPRRLPSLNHVVHAPPQPHPPHEPHPPHPPHSQSKYEYGQRGTPAPVRRSPTPEEKDTRGSSQRQQYGYGSGSPTTASNQKRPQQQQPSHHYDGTRVPRRSSLKGSSQQQQQQQQYGYGSGSPTTASNQKRPQQQQQQQQQHPSHHYDGTRVPRRSSLKGSSGQSRRASIGSVGASSIVTNASRPVRVRGDGMPFERRRSIDFHKTVQVKEVVPITNSAACEELWFQPPEVAQMRLERRAVIQLHKQGRAEPTINPDEDIRGLESYLDRTGRARKHQAWEIVLLEQYEQELAGEFNDQRIADLYKSTTHRSPAKAALMGQEDHEVVQDYLRSPRTTKLMSRRLSC